MKVKLGEICAINPKLMCSINDDTSVSFIPMQSVSENGEIDISKQKKYSEVKKGFTAFQEGDVLFAKITPCMENGKGAVARKLINGVGFGSTEFHVLRPDKNKVLSDWLYYQTKHSDFREQAEKNMTGSAGQKRVPSSFILNCRINIYSIEQQQKQTDTLSLLDILISLRKQQLTKLDALVKSQFIEMFGNVEVNEKSWDAAPLGSLCQIYRGGSPRPIEKFLGGTVPWIKIGDGTQGDNIYLNSTKEHIIQEGVKGSRFIKAGSLIFANCGVSLGFARIITFDGCIHDGWLSFSDISPRLNKIFLLKVLNQNTEYFRRTAPNGTQPNLNIAIMKSYMQIIPPLYLQEQYITFVEQVDKSKFEVQKSLDNLETLKRALMQQYFG